MGILDTKEHVYDTMTATARLAIIGVELMSG